MVRSLITGGTARRVSTRSDFPSLHFHPTNGDSNMSTVLLAAITRGRHMFLLVAQLALVYLGYPSSLPGQSAPKGRSTVTVVLDEGTPKRGVAAELLRKSRDRGSVIVIRRNSTPADLAEALSRLKRVEAAGPLTGTREMRATIAPVAPRRVSAPRLAEAYRVMLALKAQPVRPALNGTVGRVLELDLASLESKYEP